MTEDQDNGKKGVRKNLIIRKKKKTRHGKRNNQTNRRLKSWNEAKLRKS